MTEHKHRWVAVSDKHRVKLRAVEVPEAETLQVFFDGTEIAPLDLDLYLQCTLCLSTKAIPDSWDIIRLPV